MRLPALAKARMKTCSKRWSKPPAPRSRTGRCAPACARSTATASRSSSLDAERPSQTTRERASAQVAGVVGHLAGGARRQRRAHLGRDLALLPGLGIDVNIDRLDHGQHLRLARPAQLAAERHGGGAKPARPDANLNDVVEACRGLPLHDLAHGLDFEGAVEGITGTRQGRAHEFECGEVGIVCIARVEHHVLGIALLVAHAQIVAEGLRHGGGSPSSLGQARPAGMRGFEPRGFKHGLACAKGRVRAIAKARRRLRVPLPAGARPAQMPRCHGARLDVRVGLYRRGTWRAAAADLRLAGPGPVIVASGENASMAEEGLLYMSAQQAAAMIRRRKLSPVELTEAVLARIERIAPLNAFVTVLWDEARAAARAAE